jgi:hypothetical protein
MIISHDLDALPTGSMTDMLRNRPSTGQVTGQVTIPVPVFQHHQDGRANSGFNGRRRLQTSGNGMAQRPGE